MLVACSVSCVYSLVCWVLLVVYRVSSKHCLHSLEQLTGTEIAELAGDNVAYADVDGFYDRSDNLIVELHKREFFGMVSELLSIDDVLIIIISGDHYIY